ncbi:hypothetical protein NM688_g448 [Phlebia brevispora]|uniref:Uncharacterized protein n=1 Tax=Phlebia brevispora TaxID=194682 RepID=A0ACC1TEQ0_9APHY|nr:hypothetical protein NM688_g448 [Phlebia brevispora]
MNGAEPRGSIPQKSHPVQSTALQRGADEILRLFFGNDNFLKPAAQKRVTEATVAVQTENNPDEARLHLGKRLEEEISKLAAAEARIAELQAQLQEKDVTITELRKEIRDFKEIVHTLGNGQAGEDDDVVMLEARPSVHGEPVSFGVTLLRVPLRCLPFLYCQHQSLDELTLVGNFINADGEPLQLEDLMEPQPFSSIYEAQSFGLDDTTTVAPSSLEPQTFTDPSAQSCSRLDEDLKSDVEVELKSDIQVYSDEKSDVSFDYHSSGSESDDSFPYPDGFAPPERLRKPIQFFIPGKCEVRSVQVPASPLHPDEEGVGFTVNDDSDSSDDEHDRDPD